MMDTPETQASTDPKAAMAIVACFEGFVNYLYPMLVNTSRQHRVLRDTVIAACFAQYKLAGFEKSGDMAARDQFLASWRGHAQWADCRNLLAHLGVTP